MNRHILTSVLVWSDFCLVVLTTSAIRINTLELFYINLPPEQMKSLENGGMHYTTSDGSSGKSLSRADESSRLRPVLFQSKIS